jgi:hypothetical protein
MLFVVFGQHPEIATFRCARNDTGHHCHCEEAKGRRGNLVKH